MKNLFIKILLSPVIIVLAALFIFLFIAFLWYFHIFFNVLLYVSLFFLITILFHAYVYKKWFYWKKLKEYEIKMKSNGFEFFDIKGTKVLARNKKHALKMYNDQIKNK